MGGIHLERRDIALLGLGVGMELGWLGLLYLGDLTRHMRTYEAVFFAIFALYLAAVWLVVRSSSQSESNGEDEHKAASQQLLPILVLAVLFRLTMLFAWPTLSDDIYRYVWDGKVFNAGLNPYRYPPNTPALEHLRHRHWQRINAPEQVTPYPPLSQVLFATVHRLAPDNLWAMKGAMVLLDLLVLLVLLRLLGELRLDRRRLLIYAWSPLVVLQFAFSGHNDVLMILLLLAALYFDRREKPYYSALALAGATLTKFVPLLALPLFVRRWGWKPTLLYVLAMVGAYLPFLDKDWQVVSGLLTETRTARFNDGLFYLLTRVTSLPIPVAKGIAALVLIGAILFLLVRNRTLVVASFTLLALYLLLTPSLHPWYVCWLVPFLAIYLGLGKQLASGESCSLCSHAALAWLAFSGLVVLSDLMYVTRGQTWIWIRIAEYGPLLAGLLVALLIEQVPRIRVAFGVNQG